MIPGFTGGRNPLAPAHACGYHWLYLQHVLQAALGCDFDLLRAEFRAVE